MAEARRRLVRPPPAPPTPDAQRQRRLDQLRARLERERGMFTRWLTRLKRAFHVVEKQLRRMARIERQIHQQEEV
jgi:hypothetical protein